MVKNYIINFFKSIVVVDFLTLNKKAVLLFVVMMALSELFIILYMMPNENIFASYAIDVRWQMLNTLGWSVTLIFTGLVLPLLIQTPFAYVSLWAGVGALEWFIYLIIHGTAEDESKFHFWGVLVGSVLVVVLYAILVRYLRKKYLTNTGRN